MSRRKRPVDFVLDPTYLAEWRKFKKLTQQQVGNLIGIDKSALGRIENGTTPYDQIHLQQLRGVYGVEIPDLLYTDPKRQVDVNRWPISITEQEKRSRKARIPRATADLYDLVKKIGPEDVEAAKTIIEMLLTAKKKS